ncbi:MAG: PIG-L family deacetylase, partial [Gemmatimonadaceae bacterium]
DEDTNLITWLQRGGRAHTAYLSLTRGDGGQNLIGNELGEELGIIRTEELLAARRVDGAHQFFSRAYDFGYSKSAEETYTHWPKDSLLNDVVTVVRAWRPHVIVAMFSGTPRDGHGQHQVSAMLAREAYEVAGDTVRFPVRDFGPAWTPLKFYRTARFDTTQATLKVNVGEYDASLRRSYAEIAGESRSQHKSQGFGALQRRGVVWNYVSRQATRVNESTPAGSEQSMFDGVAAVRPFDIGRSSYDSVASHIFLDAFADRNEVAVGDSARVVATLYNRSRRTIYVMPEPTEGLNLLTRNGRALRRFQATGKFPDSLEESTAVLPDSSLSWELSLKGTRVTQPWWLTLPRNGDLFAPPLPRLEDGDFWREMPENERTRGHVVKAIVTLDTLGSRVSTVVGMGSDRVPAMRALIREAPVVYRFLDPVRGEVQRPIAVTPRISVSLDNASELARADMGLDRFVNVTLRSAVTKPQPVRVSLSLPAGLTADSASRSVTLDSAGTRRVTFRVRGRLAPGVHEVSASASAGEQTFTSGYIPIDYEHITPQRLYRRATVQLRAVDVRVPAGTNLAYVQGVGDKVAIALQQLGIPVTIIRPSDIPTADLSRFSAVVTGPRAYDAHSELIHNNTYLLDYARSGGTLVVQYGQYEMMRPGVMPYPISIARPHDRVTEETAPVRILDPSASVLSRPNRVTETDFQGWVQERGLYMPRTFDERYRAVLETNDPGAPPNRGGIIVAPYGRGTYVYTTLAFFRQLPAGVSGAAKLFVNLVTQGAQ